MRLVVGGHGARPLMAFPNPDLLCTWVMIKGDVRARSPVGRAVRLCLQSLVASMRRSALSRQPGSVAVASTASTKGGMATGLRSAGIQLSVEAASGLDTAPAFASIRRSRSRFLPLRHQGRPGALSRLLVPPQSLVTNLLLAINPRLVRSILSFVLNLCSARSRSPDLNLQLLSVMCLPAPTTPPCLGPRTSRRLGLPRTSSSSMLRRR
jgi:hypothetical protein